MTYKNVVVLMCCVTACMANPALASDFTGYSYDALGRLRGVCHLSTSGERRTQYFYDSAGNRTYYESSDANTVIVLGSGQVMQSQDKRFTLTMQSDGNLVLTGPTGILWSSNTAGQSGAVMQFQPDGNLVLYRSGTPIWASGTDGNQCGSLNLQNDGNLVIYAMGAIPVWATNTSGH